MNQSVKHAALVCGNHVFNVDEGVLASRLLQQLQSLHDEVSQVQSLPLAVLDLVPDACVVISENVEDGQDLAIVGHQCFSNHFSGEDKLLDDFEHCCNDLRITGIESS